MENMFNANALDKLIAHYHDDKDSLDIIYDVLMGFEEYHERIVEMEIKLKLYSTEVMEREDYQSMVMELDKRRTMQHNSILTGVNVLNRMAEKCCIEPVYSGKVSTERPFRREVANAILEFTQTIIIDRR